MKRIYLGSDHRGWEMKEKLKRWLVKKGWEVVDFSNQRGENEKIDYPDVAHPTATKIAEGKAWGILLCGSGIGVAIVANRYQGVRCALGLSPAQVKHGRTHDDINCLSLAADFTEFTQAKAMVETFLETDFAAQSRFKRRLEKIERKSDD